MANINKNLKNLKKASENFIQIGDLYYELKFYTDA